MKRKIRAKKHIIKVYCSSCGALLCKYQKEKEGRLLKCFEDKVIEDYTDGDIYCPNCQQKFARETIISGRLARKIIRGKVFTRK
ncbi:hypothetical protein J7J23_00200 [bacterium]|nr:hypothetical protein [bacterium]